MPNLRGSTADGPDDGAGPLTGRKYPMRPIGKKYPMRPIGAGGGRKYPMRPYDPRQDLPPQQPDKYPMRPYDWRKYPMRPYDDSAGLDADEWTADISELFCCASAVVRLGARLVYDGDAVPVPQVPLEGPGPAPAYHAPGLVSPPMAPALQVLRPASHELSVAVDVSNQLAQSLADRPDVAWAVKEDIANALALAADGAFLNGPGALQIAGLAGIAPQTVLPPPPPPHDPLALARAMVAELRGAGPVPAPRPLVPFRSAGWVLDPLALAALAGLQTEDALAGVIGAAVGRGPRALDDTDLLIYDGHDGGELLGYPFWVSEGAGAGNMFLGADWGDACIGVAGDIVSVDFATDAGFVADGTTIRATMRHDFVVRRAEGFRQT